MVKIRQEIKHESGTPLGGIGTGTVEIRPDGLFHEWQVFNAGPWSPGSACQPGQIMRPEDMVFIIRTKDQGGKVTVRYLALREQLHDMYTFAWLRSVRAIEFDGRFPVAALTYQDPELPVDVEAEFFSPFIPHDSRGSGTPGFYVQFRVRNPSGAPVEVSLLGTLRNPVGLGQDGREAHNRLGAEDGAPTIVLGADNLQDGHCTAGDMAFSASGGQISYISGAFSAERPGARMDRSLCYGYKVYSYIRRFRETGRLPNLSPETCPFLPDDFSAARLSADERRRTLDLLIQHSLFHDKLQRLSTAIPDLSENQDRLIEFLDDSHMNLQELADRRTPWGDAALCSRFEVSPGEMQESLFTLSWYFPNHVSPSGKRIGHMYENWFDGSLAVNRHMTSNYRRFRERTFAFPDALYASSLPPEVADAASGQLTTLTKCTWWTKEGHFGVWEGLGCCGFHTIDITYQGSFPIIALFPDLQKMQMTHGAKFQRSDGRVHHFFTPDFYSVDNGFDRVDMNQQFVMMAARDYLWTGDRAYLEQVWPHIIRAMDNTAELDADDDGLPDHDTRRNTYDAWDFTGTPAYIASLWLGALKAAVRLAKEMGDIERAAVWQATYERGVESFEASLWNGEYYVLWKDEATDRVDPCCMSDQISGDWFCGVMGWGPICKPERIRKALESILKHNFRRDSGLINASYPAGIPQKVATSGNLQADATWTGIEYTVAALLIEYGIAEEGLTIVRDIHERYLSAGRFWSHVECGHHYYRALSSWTPFMALSGFHLDVPGGELSFSPAVDAEKWECPFMAPGAWGIYRQSESGGQIEVMDGSLMVRTLSLPRLGIPEPTIKLNEETLEYAEADGRFEFVSPVSMYAGDVLSVG